MSEIRIVREPTHGRRIVCGCGYEDKTFPQSARGAADVHNNKEHGGKYRIVDDVKP